MRTASRACLRRAAEAHDGTSARLRVRA